MSLPGHITTGELARLAGVHRETIRFYERNGLLPPPPRTETKYRQFTSSDLQRVRFIARAKKLGFALREIGELLAVADGVIVRCSKVRDIAERKVSYIDSQLEDLRRLRTSLRSLIMKCATVRRINGCPIIDSLLQGDK